MPAAHHLGRATEEEMDMQIMFWHRSLKVLPLKSNPHVLFLVHFCSSLFMTSTHFSSIQILQHLQTLRLQEILSFVLQPP